MQSPPECPLLLHPENILESIRKIYDLEKPGQMDKAIDIIEIWLKKQDHILNKEFYTRDFIETTIIASKGSLEKAKKLLDRLATMKTLLPKYFAKTDIKEHLEDFSDFVYAVPMPRLTEDFHRIVIIKINDTPFTSNHLFMYFQLIINLAVFIKANDYANGFIIIYDFRNASITDLLGKINLTETQQFISILIEGFGARLKCIHILTQSKTIELFVKTMKQFVSEKVSKRMEVVPILDDLYKSVPKKLLSEDYGGSEKSLFELQKIWMNELSKPAHQKYMEALNTVYTDEDRRKSCKFNEEYLGMPGSFRSLIVD